MCVIITRNKLERYQFWQREPAERTAEAVAFWTNEYPQIATTNSIAVELSATGFHPLDPIICPNNAWSNYYEPLRDSLHPLRQLQTRTEALSHVTTELENEIAVHDRAGNDVAFVFVSAALERKA